MLIRDAVELAGTLQGRLYTGFPGIGPVQSALSIPGGGAGLEREVLMLQRRGSGQFGIEQWVKVRTPH